MVAKGRYDCESVRQKHFGEVAVIPLHPLWGIWICGTGTELGVQLALLLPGPEHSQIDPPSVASSSGTCWWNATSPAQLWALSFSITHPAAY